MSKLLIYSALFMLLANSFSCIKPDPFPDHDKQKKLQAVVDKIRKNLSDSLGFPFPSLNLLIQTPTDKIFVSSIAEGHQKVTPHTYYRFASNTKNFTAAAILNMYEDGWLDYKAKISDVIPGTKLTYVPASSDWDFPYKNEITIEKLLQHNAGVFDVDNDTVPGYNGHTYTEFVQKAEPGHQFTTTEMVKVLKEKNLFYYAPGGGYHYSNIGYSILAEIIKRVYSEKAGKAKTYADYIYDYVTGPYTPTPLPEIRFPVLATDISMPNPHLTSTILTENGPEIYDAFNMTAQIGEGNGYGTMDALNKHIRSLMKGQSVLKPATVQLMQKNASAANPHYGLGSSFIPNIGYGHNGARLGFLNLMSYDPDYDVSIIVMIDLYDLRNGTESFTICFNALLDAAYGARQILGFPGKP